MKPIMSIALLACVAALPASPLRAAGERVSPASDPVVSAAIPGMPNDSASATAFASRVCRVPAGSQSEMSEMSAFEHWQGAATAPVGHSETLVYGAMLQDVALEPVVQTRLSVAPQADTDADTDSATDDLQVRERRRMFLLGLAILLNINAKQ